MSNRLGLFVQNQKEFLSFLRSRYNVFHESNVFFRDLHYGVMAFLELNKLPNGYLPSEELTRQVIGKYEEAKILLPIDSRTWMVNYPAFRKAPLKPVAAPRPAAPAAKPAAAPGPALPSGTPSTFPAANAPTDEVGGTVDPRQRNVTQH
jgi:hypothetical protein